LLVRFPFVSRLSAVTLNHIDQGKEDEAMTLVPYGMTHDPFLRQIDRLFDEAVREVAQNGPAWRPACNISEDEKGFYIEAAVPGLESKDIEATVEDGVLTLKGQRAQKTDERATSWLVHEIGAGAFSRSLRLPEYVDHEHATASYKNGVLSLTFPKCEEAKPRRIMIGE
jgi:HSP20 family protein